MKPISLIATTALVAFSSISQAALIDRGSGMIYDDQLNITWLQDANYAATSGYTVANQRDLGAQGVDALIVESSGRMSWTSANQWAENLTYGGYNDWRLPTTRDDINVGRFGNFYYSGSAFNDPFNANTGPNTNKYFSYEIPETHNELAHMYYKDLDRLPYSGTFFEQRDKNAFYQSPPNTAFCSRIVCSSESIEPFNNLFTAAYWTNLSVDSTGGEYFSFGEILPPGTLGADARPNTKFAWAVRNGDVFGALIPIPSSVFLFGSGLLGLIGLKRKNPM